MDADLLKVLSEEQFLPIEAMRRASTHPELISEPVLRLLDQAAADPDALTDEEANLLFWGLHALATGRDTRVFQPLLRMLRQDAEPVEGILGDAIAETLPMVLASTFDGDGEALNRFILDSTVDEFVRGAAFTALAFLTRQGLLELSATRRLIERFDDARASVEEYGWVAWESTIAYLGMSELAPRVEAARKDGRLTDAISDHAWFRKALKAASAEPPDFSDFDEPQYAYLDDPVAALDWTAEDFGQPVTNPYKDVGRNDPCPCGSGKKFKKCCLNAENDAAASAPLPALR